MTRLASAHVTASGRLYMREMERENGVQTEVFSSNERGESCSENIVRYMQFNITYWFRNKIYSVIYVQNMEVSLMLPY
jgi:hypothetical protein